MTAPVSSQSTIQSAFVRSQPYTHESRRWKELTNHVTCCLVADELPIYTVQKEGFKKMLKAFDSRYELPDQSYFSRKAVPELYAVTKDRVVREVATVNHYAATTDLWSSVDILVTQSSLLPRT